MSSGGSGTTTGTTTVGSGGGGSGGADGGLPDAPPDGPIACLHQSDCTPLDDACNIGSCFNNVCMKTPANEGATCDDGMFCTDNDVCVKGTCVGSPKTCPPMGDCTTGMCDETAKMCSTMVGNDGAPCTPMNDKCFSSGFCSSGACIGTTPVDCSFFDDMCHTGSCDSVMGCVQTDKPNGTFCDDNQFCTTNDMCVNGTCMGAPMVCPPTGDPCKVNQCNNASFSCQIQSSPDGTACSTMSVCVTGETCTAGTCGGGTPANQGMPCMNANACVGNSHCNNGTCSGTPITMCVGGDGCCPAGCTLMMDSDCNCSINLALTAVGSVSPGGGSVPPYTPAELNNGIGKSQCNRWSWISNGDTPTGAWFELDWTTPQTIASMYVETTAADGSDPTCPGSAGRNVAGADVQWWNGSAWVTATTFAGKTTDFQLDVAPPVVTTKLRLNNVVTAPGGSNSLIREWHVFGAQGCIPPAD